MSFTWIGFNREFADKLLPFRNNRKPLVDVVYESEKEIGFNRMVDKFKDGSSVPSKDICPFTFMARFTRGIASENRLHIQNKFANLLNVNTPPPNDTPFVPQVDTRNSWFYPQVSKRNPDHIDELWNVFSNALAYADNKSEHNRSKLIKSFDTVIKFGTSRNMLAMGLFWIRPYEFLPLDKFTQEYLEKEIGTPFPESKNGEIYLEFVKKLKNTLEERDIYPRTLPELSLDAYPKSTDKSNNDTTPPEPTDKHTKYSIDDIKNDGCFVKKETLESIMERLQDKKNLILDGPPGTGKTYLAKKLAYALIGEKDNSCVRVMQFHPNLSYEDFVRGWRPTKDKLALTDGPFLTMIDDAKSEPESKFVMIIEEINRGNPANIFGELLTLIEADKRSSDNAISLSYSGDSKSKIYVPENLYIIGTMNVADRSIAMVDLALRRRFAFASLEPIFDKATWNEWVSKKSGIDTADLDKISNAMENLNETINNEPSLGPNFKVGHSYVTPSEKISDTKKWWANVVKYDIGPLLKEYWFDNQKIANGEIDKLSKLL